MQLEVDAGGAAAQHEDDYDDGTIGHGDESNRVYTSLHLAMPRDAPLVGWHP